MIGRTALIAVALFKDESYALVCEGSLGLKLGRGIAVLLSAQ
jgi:hypothetical protein